MIKLENLEVHGLEPAIRGMRNPKRTKGHPNPGDSGYCDDTVIECKECPHSDADGMYCTALEYNPFILGPKDRKLANNLCKGGPVHAKFLRQIQVWIDITAPFYWWKEFETYKVGTTSNSASTMHMITKDPFEITDFSTEHLDAGHYGLLAIVVATLNDDRRGYLLHDQWLKEHSARDFNDPQYDDKVKYHEDRKQHYWWQIIQTLGTNYNQLRTINLNYEVLRNIYSNRRWHKLDEWRELCKWIETLPYSELITGVDENGNQVL